MRQIGNYAVEDIPLGSGGMGRVLKGYDLNGVPVAIKEILPEFVRDNEYRYRIEQEINFLKSLNRAIGNNHSIVKVYDSFELDNHIYIVMELVEGMNIEQVIATRGRLSFKEALPIMTQILDAMQLVHEHKVVHRDIKPGNIMVRPDGTICILDFGVAKNASGNGPAHTIIGTVMGTDGYMSPEQANGLSLDHRTDIYSLACVFYFILTGQHAFLKTDNDVEMAIQIVNKEFPRLSKHLPKVKNGLQEILDKATDKNMMKRYQSCREFRMDLKRLSSEGTQINVPLSQTGNRVSIGRENCDICVFFDNYKVSRHHADVTLQETNGLKQYIYTDCSSNGSMVNGQMLQRGMMVLLPEGSNPEIYLANDRECKLDWNLVTGYLSGERTTGETVPVYDFSENKKKGFFGWFKRLFKKF